MDAKICSRARRRLEAARNQGYLDATCAKPADILRTHGLWCWRLRIPFVWFERQSPHSRYGNLHLEMLTTPHTLTPTGQQALRELPGQAKISGEHGFWKKIPLRELDRLAREAYRQATQPGNHRSKAADTGKSSPRKAIAAAA